MLLFVIVFFSEKATYSLETADHLYIMIHVYKAVLRKEHNNKCRDNKCVLNNTGRSTMKCILGVT